MRENIQCSSNRLIFISKSLSINRVHIKYETNEIFSNVKNDIDEILQIRSIVDYQKANSMRFEYSI